MQKEPTPTENPKPYESDIVTQYLKSISGLRSSAMPSLSAITAERIRKALSVSGQADQTVKSLGDIFKLPDYYENTSRLRTEINELEEKARNQALEIQKHVDDKSKTLLEISKLQSIIDELTSKQDIQHLLNSLSVDAHSKVENDEKFREKFTSEEEIDSFVVSVDIRRSTELMLKARSPRLFAQFITTLCKDLEDIFKNNWAVVDKFTGDGILAFFPAFYSGKDAGFLALKAATEANEAFTRIYREFRTSFTSVLFDVGLGTGIDYGKVHLIRMAGALTIVGQPVVYACRMGGAPAGEILLNQPAYEIISKNYAHVTSIEETVIPIKGEGGLVAYRTHLSGHPFSPASPEWQIVRP